MTMSDGLQTADHLAELSARERLVAARFADGMTYREIGEALFIAPSTVRTHLNTIYRKLGVSSKVGLARIVSEQQPDKATDPSHPRQAREGAPLVAVLPFDDLSVDGNWAGLADGLTSDIISNLARYAHIAVAARQTTLLYRRGRGDLRSIGSELNADYLLEGSLQASGGQVRIWIQLVDVASGASLWASKYDQPAGDLFAIQDTVTDSVVNALGGCYGKFIQLRRDLARRRPAAARTAYDCYMLGIELLDADTHECIEQAIALLSEATAIDPGFARAWTRLGFGHHSLAYNAYVPTPSLSLQRCISCIEMALSLDPEDIAVRQTVGCLRAWRGDLKGVKEENARALASAPNDSMTLVLVAERQVLCAGDPQEACDLVERAIGLNPDFAPPWYFATLGHALLVAGRHAESVEAQRRGGVDGIPSSMMFHAMACAMAGDDAEAAEYARRLAKEFPAFTVSGFVETYPVVNPRALAVMREAARRAGLA